MVSKAAVIAIVAILAVPIFLGYALNVEQVTETDYKTTGDPVNVTQLLKTGSSYSYTSADSLQINSNFRDNLLNSWVLPLYESITTNITSYPLSIDTWQNGHPNLGGIKYNEWEYVYFQSDYSGSGAYLTGEFVYAPDGTIVNTINRLHSFYFNNNERDSNGYAVIHYNRYTNDGSLTAGTLTMGDRSQWALRLTHTGTYLSDSWIERYQPGYINNNYADISAGWTLTSPEHTDAAHPERSYLGNIITLPAYTNDVLYTINLSSITDSNYRFNIGQKATFTKTTVGSDVHWTFQEYGSLGNNLVDEFEIYYDQGSTNNTYQFRMVADPDRGYYDTDSSLWVFPLKYELRYVGQWPDLIGEANYYQYYSADSELRSLNNAPSIKNMVINYYSEKTPIMRVDYAKYRAMEYPVIANKTYDPAAFKSNPSTTINDPIVYGSSFTFGGNTYTVSKGNITMGTHDIPVKGLVLSSVPNPLGGYDNKIGNTVISTTAAPSAITFNGKWSASITTSAQEEYQVTKTEWKAGDFAWDGIDHNFIMAGLLASLGAFVGVGIYARRTRSSVWPLLIVCGGAALLFFVML